MTQRWETHPQTLQTLKRLVRHDAVIWGCLKDLTTAEEVSERLIVYPPTLIPDLCTAKKQIYHTTDLGVGCVQRVCTSVLETAIHLGSLDKDALVTLRYQHGNVFCYIKPYDLPPTVSLTKDVYLTVGVESQILADFHLGKYHWHHALYQYTHLDGKVTTLQKLLATKRFTSVCIDTYDDTYSDSIPY